MVPLRFVLCHFNRSGKLLCRIIYSDTANILDAMDLKQIIALHLDGTSNRMIVSILGILPNTVNTYMQLFAASGIPLKELLAFENSDLSSSHTTVDTDGITSLYCILKNQQGLESPWIHLFAQLSVIRRAGSGSLHLHPIH